MLGSDKSRGYCLEMIGADFWAGANLGKENPEVLLQSARRFFKFLPGEERAEIYAPRYREGVVTGFRPKHGRVRLNPELYEELHKQVLRRDGWRCQSCGTMSNLEVHHKEFRSQSGDDSEENLITLCAVCHDIVHHSCRVGFGIRALMVEAIRLLSIE